MNNNAMLRSSSADRPCLIKNGRYPAQALSGHHLFGPKTPNIGGMAAIPQFTRECSPDWVLVSRPRPSLSVGKRHTQRVQWKGLSGAISNGPIGRRLFVVFLHTSIRAFAGIGLTVCCKYWWQFLLFERCVIGVCVACVCGDGRTCYPRC